MSETQTPRIPSLAKKYLMAITGLILVLFVLGHMLGNLQFFMGPEAINAYAYKLHHLPGNPVSLWLIRSFGNSRDPRLDGNPPDQGKPRRAPGHLC